MFSTTFKKKRLKQTLETDASPTPTNNTQTDQDHPPPYEPLGPAILTPSASAAIDKLIEPQGFKIWGGPRYTSAVYRQLESKTGREIANLEFLMTLSVGGVDFVFCCWKVNRRSATIYGILNKDIGKFCDFASNGFQGEYKGREGYFITWGLDRYLGNCKTKTTLKDSEKKLITPASRANSEKLTMFRLTSHVHASPMNKDCHQMTG
ncbi:hypothetical protein Cantr_04635 [Candida viswanathii]|uniref:Uncharacterized protein n=1 Tax=Candida viswanathii TaxID=5486 RepID=A0A367XL69_9ASCO|nr:hypothetical protein Cantr_04635 [Candida viswanathii]